MSIEPGTQAFLDQLAAAHAPPIYALTPEGARKLLRSAQAVPVPAPAVDIEDRTLSIGPTGQVRVRIIRPQGAEERLPVVVYFHGAGWVMGGVDTHDRLVREIAHGAQVAVVFVDYDRAPESRYPIAIEQDYAVTQYVADHPGEFNVDAARLAVAGDSVGGNMTAVVSLLAKERKGAPIAFQLLFYPVTDANCQSDSYRQFSNGPWLTREAMKWFWNAYLPDQSKRNDWTISPLHATAAQLKDLPPALVITAENDVLRDEGEAYAAKLAQSGVKTTSVRYQGTIHDFVMLNALYATPAARSAVALATAALRGALGN
jgi:acetyl esterase